MRLRDRVDDYEYTCIFTQIPGQDDHCEQYVQHEMLIVVSAASVNRLMDELKMMMMSEWMKRIIVYEK